MRNRVKTILISLSAVLVLVAGSVVGTNLVTADTAPRPAVTVTFNYNGATGGTSVTTATVTSGTQANTVLPLPTKPGVSFSGWFSTQSLLNGQRITTIEESDAGTLIAGFVPPELAQALVLALPPIATCAQGGACVLGDTGPGGGLVFYDAGPVQPWGRYLEMAPNTWSGSSSDDMPTLKWCNVNTVVTTSLDIGTGAANTAAMNSACSSADAAAKVLAYAPPGTTAGQWFVPSLAELSAMYNYKGSIVNTVKYGFSNAIYWSSSQQFDNAAHFRNLGNGDQFGTYKTNPQRVRPVRAF